MANSQSTNFIPRQTLISAAWLNWVDQYTATAEKVQFISSNADITDELEQFIKERDNRKDNVFAGNSDNLVPLEIDFCYVPYNITRPISLNGNHSAIIFKNFSFIAVNTSVPTGIHWNPTTDFMFNWDGATGGRVIRSGFINGTINCNKLCSGIRFATTTECYIKELDIVSQTYYGVKADTSNRRILIQGGSIQEYGASDPYGQHYPNRTSTAVHIEKSDGIMDGVVMPCNKIGMKFDNIRNFMINKCHPWMGSFDNEADRFSAWDVDIGSMDPEEAGASGLQFLGCYFDHGPVRMVGSFAHQFNNCTWTGGETGIYPFVLVATEADEQASGLKIVDARFSKEHNANFIDWQVSGAGTWATRKLHQISVVSQGSSRLIPNKVMSSIQFYDTNDNAKDSAVYDDVAHIQISDTDTKVSMANRIPTVAVHSQYAGASFGVSQWGTNAKPPGFYSAFSRNSTVGTFGGYPQAGDILGRYVATGDNGTNFGTTNKPGAAITFAAEATWTSTSNPTTITFSVTPVGSTGDAVDSFSLDSNGNILPASNDTMKIGSAAKNLNKVYSSAYHVGSTKVIGAQDTGWTAGTGTALKGAFNANTATATQAAQRVLAIEQALRTHGLIN